MPRNCSQHRTSCRKLSKLAGQMTLHVCGNSLLVLSSRPKVLERIDCLSYETSKLCVFTIHFVRPDRHSILVIQCIDLPTISTQSLWPMKFHKSADKVVDAGCEKAREWKKIPRMLPDTWLKPGLQATWSHAITLSTIVQATAML
jgi:hypothetical protein